ncbi:hypothetical protein RIR_jg11508.t1 [Rhizophagus irregularis DAOM 181602=DAOM 197198]|nr:hypothetical protein RIR_jg11508.t1 [Rhizophagus irregularis DAOM 181602=DAOM 197198]
MRNLDDNDKKIKISDFGLAIHTSKRRISDWLELLPRLNIKSSKSKALITKLSDAITAVASPASSNTAQLWTEKNIAKTLRKDQALLIAGSTRIVTNTRLQVQMRRNERRMNYVFFKAAIAISYGDIDDENSCYVEIKSVWCVIIIIGECVMVWVEIAHMIRVTV